MMLQTNPSNLHQNLLLQLSTFPIKANTGSFEPKHNSQQSLPVRGKHWFALNLKPSTSTLHKCEVAINLIKNNQS